MIISLGLASRSHSKELDSGDNMKISLRSERDTLILTAVVCLLALLLPIHLPNTFAESVKPDLSSEEKHRLGKRLYRQGILPSGGPLKADVKGDPAAPGTSFSCVVCHLRSGIGSYQEGVYTPPISGDKLFKPVHWLYKGVEQNSQYSPTPLRRPAYSEESLTAVLRKGIDPAGRTVSDAMPRYLLTDEDMAILIFYLNSLSSKFSPGVSDKNMNFATIITDDVTSTDRDALLVPLEQYIKNKNDQANFYKKPFNRSRKMAENMFESKELSTRSLTLSRWALKGPPETWRSQLDEYYRTEPVFAFLGGITNSDWKPIHQFCEDKQIPCLLPNTDFPVISESNGYTLYPSKGYYQEGEAAARYLAGRADVGEGGQVLQIVRDSLEGRALSAGFDDTWHVVGNRTPVTVRLTPGEKVTRKVLRQLLDREKPAAMMLWDGPESLTALEMTADGDKRPAVVMVSSRYLGKSLLTLPEQARDFAYITYPFMLAQKVTIAGMGSITVSDEDKVSAGLAKTVAQVTAHKIRNLANSLTQILTMALMEMKGNYYRDNFLDVINLLPDQLSPEFGKLSFSPENQYASNGCYIVQLTKGPNPDLVKKSAWVIH
jgi:hypothetical protein